MRDKSFADRIKFDLTETKEKEFLKKYIDLIKNFKIRHFKM